MHDDSALMRQWILLRTLCARRHGITVREMSQEFGVTEKTIRRDLEKLKSLAFPIVETNGDHGRKSWRLADQGNVPPMTFSYDESVVLYLARPLLAPLVGTHFWDAAQSALSKIKATLSEQALDYLDKFPSYFHYTNPGHGDYTDKSDVIDTLSVAIEDRMAVLMTYQSQHATEPRTREIYPYTLVRHKGSLYLIALAVEHEAIRRYKVDRIAAAEVTSFVFERPADFDASAYLADSFGIYSGSDEITVVVKFDPAAERYVCESKWHASQVLCKHSDGSLLARFQLSSTVEIKSWVLSFGASAVVLEPEALRSEIDRELDQMRDAYSAARPIAETEIPVNGSMKH